MYKEKMLLLPTSVVIPTTANISKITLRAEKPAFLVQAFGKSGR